MTLLLTVVVVVLPTVLPVPSVVPVPASSSVICLHPQNKTNIEWQGFGFLKGRNPVMSSEVCRPGVRAWVKSSFQLLEFMESVWLLKMLTHHGWQRD